MMTRTFTHLSTAAVLMAVVTATPALERSQTDLSRYDSLTEATTALGTSDGWLSWNVPALPGQRSSCCWQGRLSDHAWSEPQACDLSRPIQGTGMSEHSPITTTVTVLARFESGSIREVIPVGEFCPLIGEGVTLIEGGPVPAAKSNRWMAELIDTADPRTISADRALSVIGVTADQGTVPMLKHYATQSTHQTGNQAIFWLGHGRQPEGLAALEELIDELPTGPLRQSINFALTQHGSDAAIERLYQLARTDPDPEQRGDALFWLAQSEADRGHDPRLVQELHQTILDTAHPVIIERALHALSTLESDPAWDVLTELATSHPQQQLRSKSLFWLTHSAPDRAKPLILEQLASVTEHGEADQTVFALSQLPGAEATASLLMVATGDYPLKVRKQALFWLAQSDDPAAMAQLEKMVQSAR